MLKGFMPPSKLWRTLRGMCCLRCTTGWQLQIHSQCQADLPNHDGPHSGCLVSITWLQQRQCVPSQSWQITLMSATHQLCKTSSGPLAGANSGVDLHIPDSSAGSRSVWAKQGRFVTDFWYNSPQSIHVSMLMAPSSLRFAYPSLYMQCTVFLHCVVPGTQDHASRGVQDVTADILSFCLNQISRFYLLQLSKFKWCAIPKRPISQASNVYSAYLYCFGRSQKGMNTSKISSLSAKKKVCCIPCKICFSLTHTRLTSI